MPWTELASQPPKQHQRVYYGIRKPERKWKWVCSSR